mmetsp:Transcript_18462/g.46611  ORF Transcript_18462/g.46611 Transcript_18462/m.46611 type:complete len:264 (+) Transcript_18462:158-949(+)
MPSLPSLTSLSRVSVGLKRGLSGKRLCQPSTIDLHVSRPTMSASLKGPMGRPAPYIMAASISSIEASPRSSMRIASNMSGTRRRLTMKPGVSLHDTVCLPIDFPHERRVSNVSAEVLGPLTTSRSFMAGTGLKKWSPPNLSPRAEVDAMSAMGREEVLEVKMVEAGAALSRSAKSFCLSPRFSGTASMTRSAVLTASVALVVCDRRDMMAASSDSAALASILPFSTALAKPFFTVFWIEAVLLARRSSEMSTIVTLYPAAAET